VSRPETASPTGTDSGMEIVAEPNTVQFVPSIEPNPVMALPLRRSLSQVRGWFTGKPPRGAAKAALPPVPCRERKNDPTVGEPAKAPTKVALASSLERTTRPAVA
jgi:hypothetical protein